MIRTIKLHTAIFATAFLGGVALVPAIASAHITERTTKAEPARPMRIAVAATKQVEGTKADAAEDKLEAARKMDAKAARKAEAKTDKAEAKMMRLHEAEASKAGIAQEKAEAKMKK
jgi:hypothetical protein